MAKYEGKIPVSEKGRGEIGKMLELWGEARKVARELLGEKGDEGFLFGGFGIVDAFFWPVLWV